MSGGDLRGRARDWRSSRCARRVGCGVGDARRDAVQGGLIWSGPTTTAAGRRRTTTAGSTSRRCSAARSRRPTRRTSRPGPSSTRRCRASQNQGYKMIFATSYGMVTKQVAAKYPNDHVRAGDRAPTSRRTSSEYFGAAEDTVFLSGWRPGQRRRTATSATSWRSDPGGDPARERVHARRAVDAPGREGAPRVDELLVRPGEGEEGRAEPGLAGRRRARRERRLAGDRPVRRVGGDQLGRVRLRRVEVRAEVVADRLRLQLGPVLPHAGQGGDGRHLEAGLLLRLDQRRLHQASPRTGPA